MANNHSTNGMHGVHPYKSPSEWIATYSLWLKYGVHGIPLTESGRMTIQERLENEIKTYEHLKK